MTQAVLTDPQYQQLAAISASDLGAGPNVHRAILAQFAAEKNAPGVQDNNPGNVHYDVLQGLGYNMAGISHGVGDSGAVAKFPTAAAGAHAYAWYIQHSPLYTLSRQAIKTDNAGDYILGITSRGYGTSRNLWDALYLTAIRLNVPAAGGGTGTGGTTPDIRGIKGSPGVPPDVEAIIHGIKPTDPVTQAEINTLANWAVSASPANLDPTGASAQTLRNTIQNLFGPYLGKPWSSVPPDVFKPFSGTQIVAGATGAGQTAAGAPGQLVNLTVPGLAQVLSALLDASNLMYGGAIVVGLILAYKGYTQLSAGASPA